jgi:hypothetical protein
MEWAIKMVTGDMIWNAELVLHHPGYYYLVAANCIRRKCAKLSGREVSPFPCLSLYLSFGLEGCWISGLKVGRR